MTDQAPIEIDLKVKINSWEGFPKEVLRLLGREIEASASPAERPSSSEAPAAQEAEAAPDPRDAVARPDADVSGEEGRTVVPLAPDISRPKSSSVDAPPLLGMHADILALLKQDLDAQDVVKILIEPLLAKWPKTRGDPKHVLSKAVEKFKVYSRRELEFARDFLLAGKHETFPDRQEIYGAMGRYKADQAEKRRERERAGGGKA